MSIRYTCGCGAEIRLPHTAAGRKAKCKSCGTVFAVPRKVAPAASTDSAEPGSWLDELASAEPDAVGEQRAPILNMASAEPAGRSAAASVAASPTEGAGYMPDNGVWISGPRRSFWADLAGSFFFFLEPANLIAFIVLVVVQLILTAAASFICFGAVVLLAFDGFICAFMMGIVRETAAGEDEFPTVWISNFWDDLFLPLIQYKGTRLLVYLPAILLSIPLWSELGIEAFKAFDPAKTWQGTGWEQAVGAAVLVGEFLWPAVVLTLAIGGTFGGLLPHTIVRTALCAPLGYLAIVAGVLAADVLRGLPEDPHVIALFSQGGFQSRFGLMAIAMILSLYSAFVAMRIIGLYYRHFKHKLPWVAE